MKRFLSGLWILLCVVCVAQTVVAGGAQRRAKIAFDDGTELFEQQKFSEAAARFREAYEIRPNWKLLYNIGQCEAAARRYGVALELFESYMAAGGDNIDLERTKELIEEMERLRNLVGFLDFQDLPMGASVTIDGLERGKSPLPGPLAVAAGVDHDVRIVKDEEVNYERALRVHSGQTLIVSLKGDAPEESESASMTTSGAANAAEETSEQRPETDAGPAASDTGESRPVPSISERPSTNISVLKYPTRQPIKAVGWVFFSIGASALITGAATGIMAWSKKKELDPDCVGGCPDELSDDKKTMENLGLATDVLLSVGGGVMATGLVMLIVGRIREKRSGIAVVPSLGNGMAGLLTTGTF